MPNPELAAALHSAEKAIILRNSRFAEEVLSRPVSENAEVFPVWYHIRSIAELALRINEEPQLKAYEDLPRLAGLSVAALESGNLSAEKLKEAEDLFERINKDVQIMMKKTPNNVNRGVNLILTAGHFTAIAVIASS